MTIRTTVAPALVLLFALAFSACAVPEGERTRTNYNILTHEELEAATSASTLYDAVNQLRPRWLSARGQASLAGSGGGIVVYQGQTQLGGVDVLRQYNRGSVHALRFLDGQTASASLPGLTARQVDGAIVLIMSERDMDR
jgi:hypothetical protein